MDKLNVIYNYITQLMNDIRYETVLPIFDEMDEDIIDDLIRYIIS